MRAYIIFNLKRIKIKIILQYYEINIYINKT